MHLIMAYGFYKYAIGVREQTYVLNCFPLCVRRSSVPPFGLLLANQHHN
jgi:hypothetical protein